MFSWSSRSASASRLCLRSRGATMTSAQPPRSARSWASTRKRVPTTADEADVLEVDDDQPGPAALEGAERLTGGLEGDQVEIARERQHDGRTIDALCADDLPHTGVEIC